MPKNNKAFESRAFDFEIKTMDETGTFEGLASVYNVVDQGGDVVEPGAFTKTIAERGKQVPIFWAHDSLAGAIGVGDLEDTPQALIVRGKLELDLPEAKSAYIRLKKGLVKGLSIGFRTIKDNFVDGVRHLRELKLLEVSLVSFPMNELAVVTAVKSEGGEVDKAMDRFTVTLTTENKSAFDDELADAQMWALRYQMMNALTSALDSIVWDDDLSREEQVSASDESIAAFHSAYIKFLPKYLSLMFGDSKVAAEYSIKAGKRISRATRAEIEKAIATLSALLEGEVVNHGTSDPNKGAAQPETPSTEPEYLHSLIDALKGTIKEKLSWNSQKS